jgi:hypothetical protein
MAEPLQAGDIFLTRGKGLISRAIRYFSRGIGEPRTKVNHVGIVVEGGPIATAVVVEALSKVFQHRLMDQYGGTSHEVAIYRPLNIPPAEIAEIVGKAKSYGGRKYGYAQVAMHLLDWMLLGAYVFRRLGSDNYPICSWVVANAYSATGYDFGVEAGAATPDDIWDYVTTHTDRYTCVRELSVLPKA